MRYLLVSPNFLLKLTIVHTVHQSALHDCELVHTTLLPVDTIITDEDVWQRNAVSRHETLFHLHSTLPSSQKIV